MSSRPAGTARMARSEWFDPSPLASGPGSSCRPRFPDTAPRSPRYLARTPSASSPQTWQAEEIEQR